MQRQHLTSACGSEVRKRGANAHYIIGRHIRMDISARAGNCFRSQVHTCMYVVATALRASIAPPLWEWVFAINRPLFFSFPFPLSGS